MPGLGDLLHTITHPLDGSQRHEAHEEKHRRRREERHRRHEERHLRLAERRRRREEHRRDGHGHRSGSSTSSSSSSDSDDDKRGHHAYAPGFPQAPSQGYPAGPQGFPLAPAFAPPAFAPPAFAPPAFAPPAFAPPSGPPPAFAPPAGPPPGFAPPSGPPGFGSPPGYTTRGPEAHAPLHPIQLSTEDHHAFPSESVTGPPPCHDLGGEAVFLGLAHMHGGLHPCKVVPAFGAGAVRVSWGGAEDAHRGTYTLVPFDPARMHWVAAGGGRVPPGARPVEGGREADGASLLHALARVDGVRVPGKAGAHLGGACVPFGNREHFVHEYELLCWRY